MLAPKEPLDNLLVALTGDDAPSSTLTGPSGERLCAATGGV